MAENISRREFVSLFGGGAVGGIVGNKIGRRHNQEELEALKGLVSTPELLLEQVRGERRWQAFEAVKAFEVAHQDEPLTEELLIEYARGPLENLFQTTFGHIRRINNDFTVVLFSRSDFNRLLTTGACVSGRDPNSTNGTIVRSGALGLTAEVRVPDVLYTRDPLSLALTRLEPDLSAYRVPLLHERVHAATISTYLYRVGDEEFVRQLGLSGLKMITYIPEEACPKVEWASLDEAATNLLVAEMNLDDRRTSDNLLFQTIGPGLFSRVEALRFFLEQVVKLSPLEFAEELYFNSNPTHVTVTLDYLVNKRLEQAGVPKKEPIQIANAAFTHIDSGDIDRFYRTIEELGIEFKIGA